MDADALTRRVATRYAKEFPSEEALKQYLKDHPGADRKRHTVQKAPTKPSEAEKPGDKKPEPEKSEVKKPEPEKPEVKKPEPEKPEVKKPEPEAAPKKSWKDRFKGLSDKARKVVESAGKGAQQFLEDDAFRKKALQKATSALAKSPKKFVHSLIATAKEEAHEFKVASGGVKEVLKGGKMSAKQKKAFKTVATHMAITGAAAALTSTGVLAGAASFSGGLSRHIAAKAVARTLEHLHILDELGHIGTGLAEILSRVASEEGEADPETAMAQLVLAAVTREVDALDDEGIKAGLEDAAESGDKEAALTLRVAARYQRTARSCPIRTQLYGGLPSGGNFNASKELEIGAQRIAEAIHCLLGSLGRNTKRYDDKSPDLGAAWDQMQHVEGAHLKEELGIIEYVLKEYVRPVYTQQINMHLDPNVADQFRKPEYVEADRQSVDGMMERSPGVAKRLITVAKSNQARLEADKDEYPEEVFRSAYFAYEAAIHLGQAWLKEIPGGWPQRKIDNPLADSKLRSTVHTLSGWINKLLHADFAEWAERA